MTPPPESAWTLDVLPDDLNWEAEAVEVAPPVVPPPPPPAVPRPRIAATETESPPPAERIVEAMLFTGGPPLTPTAFAQAVRVPPETLHQAVHTLNTLYRRQHRPYTIQPHEGGYVLLVKPMYRGLREKLVGGPRDVRLSQPTLDVLSLIAYRQPIEKADLDAIRGADSGPIIRQLIRLGLAAVAQRGDTEHPQSLYGTTPRFLELFGLGTLDDLPRLGDILKV